MNKERKSKLMTSYLNDEDELEEEEEEEEEKKEDSIISIGDKRNSDIEMPLITNTNANNISRNSRGSNRGSKPRFSGENIEQKEMLYDMGFKANLINAIYNNMHPIDLQEALDYLNKNEQGKFTHSYIENDRFVCAICNQGRNAHESTALFLDNQNINTNANRNININTPITSTINNNNINIINTRNSIRFNRLESSYLSSIKKTNNYAYDKPKECGVCSDTIEYQDISKVKISCNHYFCLDCWENYLKEKINNANVGKISCMQHGCSIVLKEQFIKQILNNDDILIKKYEKFCERQKILTSDKNIKFCPTPDCDGYAERKNKDEKYVKCNFGHEFCFICLSSPHGDKECQEMIDEGFEEWKNKKIVKRCPGCKMWTEKNEGCNHMTCVECKYQWCWLCQKKYDYNHYNYGSCKGLQFLKETDEEKIKKMLEENAKKYPNYSPVNQPLLYPYHDPFLIRRRRKCQCLIDALQGLLTFLLFLFIYPYCHFCDMVLDRFVIYQDFIVFVYMASGIPVFICFEILFFSLNFIFIVPGFLFCSYYRLLFRRVKEDVLGFYDY